MPHAPQAAPAPAPLAALAQPLRTALAASVRAMFHDAAAGERPVARGTDGLFGPGSVAWRVHADVGAMLVGGVTGLLLQMLHPAVLAGVWDHSGFRSDMHGRLRRTARFVAITTYGGRAEAEAAIGRVRAIHQGISGALPDGTPYAANDPALLAWVHLAGSSSFLRGHLRYADPFLPQADRDRYFAEMAQVAEALGACPVPRSEAEARRLFRAMRPALRRDARTATVARLLLAQPGPPPMTGPVRALAMQAAIDLLPEWARRLHDLRSPALGRPLVRAGAMGLARTLRWALR